MIGKLILVSTPIGNLGDITFRAVEILSSVDIVACEDTRHTGKLLKHLGISAKLISFHEHNEHERSSEFIDRIQKGANIAVVSDAGTPGISDPGYRLVSAAIEAGIEVTSAPGAVAFVAAAVISGLPTDAIFFGGFLPSKRTERKKRLLECANIPATLCFYESPHRLQKSLIDCVEVLGDRKAAVTRELTKLHEEAVRGKFSDIARHFENTVVKGEIVIVIDREDAETAISIDVGLTLSARVAELEATGIDRKKALKIASKEFGLTRDEAYRRLIDERQSDK